MSAARRERSHSAGPSNGARLSRLPIRDTGQASRKKSIDRKRTKSTLGEPARVSRQRSGSLLRTPLTQSGGRSIGKSPTLSSIKKDSRPISDKKWQYEQLVKVRSFFARNEPQIDHNAIKAGMPTDMFIAVTAAYFRRIDKRIIINRENYIEEVPSRLRLFRYPISVKPSLMKAVNIPHSWPSVIAILAWLHDVIESSSDDKSHGTTLQDAALKCFMDMYNLWNMMEESSSELVKPLKELENTAGEYFGNDLERLRQSEQRCRTLEASVIDYAEVNKRKRMENMALKEKCDSLHNKCEAFLLSNKAFEEKITLHKVTISKKSEQLDKELEDLIAMEKNLKYAISNQLYSITDQKQLISEIEDLKNVIRLQEERSHQQKNCVYDFDRKLSDLNQKIQSSAFNYNNVIRNMKILDPSLKELEIIESGFMRSDTAQTFDSILQKLNKKAAEMRTKLNAEQNALTEINQMCQTLEKQLEVVNSELDVCTRIEAEEQFTMEHHIARLEREKQLAIDNVNIVQNELLDLKSRRPNMDALPPNILQIQKEKSDAVDKETRDLKYKAFKFFTQLDLQISNNLLNYMKIMDELNKSYDAALEMMCSDFTSSTEFIQRIDREIDDLQSGKKD
ncbi:hypothetical protein PPYR_14089 [Photinus pyralis]|uniref:Kinetochore protein NDC80 n=1 Tax=Photinus pyralis TaxID=7054 RepID=A0A1Y1N8A3_PHOPY|nr:kinetochore protein ndc80-like [Photinus pyralis]KAB0792128.1 hypothetical protein PPYR_14089 [Photinus pyralis]